jgi:hypothetical protein
MDLTKESHDQKMREGIGSFCGKNNVDLILRSNIKT